MEGWEPSTHLKIPSHFSFKNHPHHSQSLYVVVLMTQFRLKTVTDDDSDENSDEDIHLGNCGGDQPPGKVRFKTEVFLK